MHPPTIQLGSSARQLVSSSTRRLSPTSVLPTAYCLLLSLTAGCVTQSLTIKTDPPGAKVYLNDQLLKDKTPLTYSFAWYGWYRVTVRKEGCQRLDDRKLLRAPIYLWIPFDLAMELLPFRIRDTRTWSYTLIPSPTLPTPTPPAPSTSTHQPVQPSTEPSQPAATGGAPTDTPPAAAASSMPATPSSAPVAESPRGSPITTPSSTTTAPVQPTKEPADGAR